MDTKPCLNCKQHFSRPLYLSHARFRRMLYCSVTCGNAFRENRKLKDEKFLVEAEQEKFFEVNSNSEYNQRMSEVQGLSRLYIDSKINLDTLRMMELGLRA